MNEPSTRPAEKKDSPKSPAEITEDVVVDVDIGEDFAKRISSPAPPVKQVTPPAANPTQAEPIATATTQATWRDRWLTPILISIPSVIVGYGLTTLSGRDNTQLRVTANVVDYSSCQRLEDEKHKQLQVYRDSAFVNLLLSHNQDGAKNIHIQRVAAEVRQRDDNFTAPAPSPLPSCDRPSDPDSENTPAALDLSLLLGPNDLIVAKRATSGKKPAWTDADPANLIPLARGSAGLGLDRSIEHSDITKKVHIRADGTGFRYQLRFQVTYTIGGESSTAPSEWLNIDSPEAPPPDGLTNH